MLSKTYSRKAAPALGSHLSKKLAAAPQPCNLCIEHQHHYGIQLEPGGRDSIRLLMTVDYLDHSDAESDPIPDPHCERKNCFNV